MTLENYIYKKINYKKDKLVKDKSLVSDAVDKYVGNYPIVYGVPRSGSTLVRNILNTIFDGHIKIQNHQFCPIGNKDKIVATYRDFRDCTISKWRIDPNMRNEDINDYLGKITFEEIKDVASIIRSNVNKHLNRYVQMSGEITVYPMAREERPNHFEILYLKYEDFYNNFNFLFDKFETFLDIKISKKVKEFICNEWNIDKVKEDYSDNLEGGFSGLDIDSHFHGGHIYKGKVGTWRDFIVPSDHEKLSKFFEKELKKWGYN
jgi:hypothetical protein